MPEPVPEEHLFTKSAAVVTPAAGRLAKVLTGSFAAEDAEDDCLKPLVALYRLRGSRAVSVEPAEKLDMGALLAPKLKLVILRISAAVAALNGSERLEDTT